MAINFDDVRYWECVGVLNHEDGSATYRLRVVKDKSGKHLGMEVAVPGWSGALELNEVYDEKLDMVVRDNPPICAYPLCEEPGIDLVRDREGYILRGCWEHAEEYRIEAHEAGQHEDEMFDPNCDACWDQVRAGERGRPRRFKTWTPGG